MKQRNMYHVNGLTDLDKMKEVAAIRARGDKHHPPQSTRIHLHAYGTPDMCLLKEHIEFPVEQVEAFCEGGC